jgi:two-component system sensor histidine kinase ArlS
LKLETKLTLFNTLSKLVIVTLFVLLLPRIIQNINQNFTDNKLLKQRDKLLQLINTSGVKDYVYASYSPLKPEYYSLDVDNTFENLDTIKNEKRKIDGDTIQYRILSYTFNMNKQKYLLEIGKSVDTIGETTTPLQNIAFAILVGMEFLTIIADQVYTSYVLRPLHLIIKTKLIGRKFPNFGSYREVTTSTSDFQYLDRSIHEMVETIEKTFQKEREFISNASHEIMTPISIMQSKIENLFESEDVNDDVKVRLLEMQRILNRLKSITKTLLLISQIENEQFLKEDTVGVAEMLNEVYEEISVRVFDKNISYEMDVPDNWSFVKVNKFLLFNLFFNLVNNAIKYNKENGGIKISGSNQNGNFVITVTDTGIGIDEENIPFLFDRFKKFRQSLEQDSFGLGLPIVKSIANFHQIKIAVSSEKNIGTTFTLSFAAGLITT